MIVFRVSSDEPEIWIIELITPKKTMTFKRSLEDFMNLDQKVISPLKVQFRNIRENVYVHNGNRTLLFEIPTLETSYSLQNDEFRKVKFTNMLGDYMARVSAIPEEIIGNDQYFLEFCDFKRPHNGVPKSFVTQTNPPERLSSRAIGLKSSDLKSNKTARFTMSGMKWNRNTSPPEPLPVPVIEVIPYGLMTSENIVNRDSQQTYEQFVFDLAKKLGVDSHIAIEEIDEHLSDTETEMGCFSRFSLADCSPLIFKAQIEAFSEDLKSPEKSYTNLFVPPPLRIITPPPISKVSKQFVSRSPTTPRTHSPLSPFYRSHDSINKSPESPIYALTPDKSPMNTTLKSDFSLAQRSNSCREESAQNFKRSKSGSLKIQTNHSYPMLDKSFKDMNHGQNTHELSGLNSAVSMADTIKDLSSPNSNFGGLYSAASTIISPFSGYHSPQKLQLRNSDPDTLYDIQESEEGGIKVVYRPMDPALRNEKKEVLDPWHTLEMEMLVNMMPAQNSEPIIKPPMRRK